MSARSDNTEKMCEHCGKTLFGRTDKRFCNDTCRNTFNREKAMLEKKQAHDNLPEIFKVIKKNYGILQSFGAAQLSYGTYASIKRSHFEKEGFNFRFCTSIVKDKEGAIWKFCFEYGWLEGDDEVYLAYWRDQVEIEKPLRASRGIPEF